MKNSFGNNVCVTLFGESHGECVGAVIDGMAAGIIIDKSFIAERLSLRSPSNDYSTSRCETDDFIIQSGVFNGRTTGAPICIIIPNKDINSSDYEKNRYIARPGHADYSAYVKYNGFEDYRGGGHLSGRITAALTAAGSVAAAALKNKNIYIGTHILRCGGISDRGFGDFAQDIEKLNSLKFAVLDDSAKEKMLAEIERVHSKGDSLGALLETAVIGLPAGIGEPWFDSVESVISHILFSVPAVKGVEFGDGFDFVNGTGSTLNDSFYTENGKILTETNHNGGINGGISNGMPIIVKCALKPAPSISAVQNTVDFNNVQNTVISSSGRHDSFFADRARIVIDSCVALALCDLLSQKFGTDFFEG